MSKLRLRYAGVLLLCIGWVAACGGSEFNAGGATAGSSSTTAGSSSAGANNGGSSQAGASSGGASGADQAGASPGGAAQGGSSGAPSAGATGSAGAGTAGSAGGTSVRNSGDCDVDKDCASGGKCMALSVDGFRTCVLPVPAAGATCTAFDQCCISSKPCPSGVNCVAGPLSPSCGGVEAASNVCATPQCMVAADCTGNNAICVPAGALDRKANVCLTGGCRRDADCKDVAGGKCEPVTPPCCGGPSGLFCVYPGTGCRSSADCAAGSSCTVVNQKSAQCELGGVACPG
jgi:hypothetical protein